MSAQVCTRDDFARAVLERGLSFPLDPHNFNSIAVETGFIQLPPDPVRSTEQVALEEEVARLNDEYRESVLELALAERAAGGTSRQVLVSGGYEEVRDIPDAGKSGARIEAASDRVMEIEAALRAANAKLRRGASIRPGRLRAWFSG